jgi:hypothetical protein
MKLCEEPESRSAENRTLPMVTPIWRVSMKRTPARAEGETRRFLSGRPWCGPYSEHGRLLVAGILHCCVAVPCDVIDLHTIEEEKAAAESVVATGELLIAIEAQP